MRLSLRFILPLLLVLGALAYAVVPLADRFTIRWFIRDLDVRAGLVANSAHDAIEELTRSGDPTRLRAYFTRLTQDERLYAVVFCPPTGAPVETARLPETIQCATATGYPPGAGQRLATPQGELLVTAVPMQGDTARLGTLILVHDLSFAARRSAETRRYLYIFFAVLAVAISLITVIVAQLSWRGWVRGLRGILRGEGLLRPHAGHEPPELRPFASDLRELIREIESGQRSLDLDRTTWTPETLRGLLHDELRGHEMLVVSNREPYLHDREGERVVIRRPASGLVTAIEPIMRACSGTWIAHGSGSADREVVDRHDRVAVPPGHPEYTLRRVWLTPEQEAGYYYGFANEGLWPLCHIAHTRPVFRASDWDYYRAINRRFAQAVEQESRT
ncbi:MAG TPA: trehalose-6-phosphate synthase, partial [Gemmatimonadales bacterium]|nr:trehalose-6-phosphate synthase [Gemmatimonadales bacterium]